MCAYIFNTLQTTRLMLYWDSYDVIKSTHKKYYGHIHLNITTLTNYVPGQRCRNRLTLKSILGHTDRQTDIYTIKLCIRLRGKSITDEFI